MSSPAVQTHRRALFAGILCLVLALSIIVYYWIMIPSERSFGERYVNSEIPLLFPSFPIMSFKPITLMVYLTFLGTVLVLEAVKGKLRRRNMMPYKISLLLVAFATGYEVLWNFFAWFTLWERQGGLLDAIPNTTHDYVILPVNFNFASKIIFLLFALSLYSGLLLERLQRSSD